MLRVLESVRICLIAMMLGAPSASGQVRYAITPLSGLNPGQGRTTAFDLNNGGVVVGSSSLTEFGFERPVYWVRGVIHELPTIPDSLGVNAGGRAINNSGLIAGVSPFPNNANWGCRVVQWADEKLIELETLAGGFIEVVFAMNDMGIAVGWSGPEVVPDGHTAVRWTEGVIEDLGQMPGDHSSIATGVNNRGVVVGWSGDPFWTSDGLIRAVRWDAIGISELPLRPGDIGSLAQAINNAGIIAGMSGPGELSPDPNFPIYLVHYQPVRWVGHHIETLPLLEGDNGGEVYDINNTGEIVGVSQVLDEFGFPLSGRPVVWTRGGVIDLNAAAGPGWVIFQANAINDRGEIAGTGTFEGVQVGFVMTPDRARGH